MTEPEISLAKPVMEVVDKVRQIVEDAFYAGKAKGRNEVVEWIKSANHSGDFYYSFDQAELEAKLQEWGIG